MNFTTPTKLARNGKKEFHNGIKVVLSNNEDIGLVIGKDVYVAMKDSWLIEQLREEMREANDTTTVKLVKKAQQNDCTNSIWFDDFKKKYDLS